MTTQPGPYTILVALQDDATADETMRQAFRLAATAGETELHAVTVVPAAASTGREMQALDKALEAAPEVIERIAERTAPAGQNVTIIGHARAGQAPARSIIQLAVDIDADIIVVGTHRRTGLEKMVLGSVAEAVLHGAHCPVLIAMPKDYEGLKTSPSIEPPCPDCLQVRRETSGDTFWCERHRATYRKPHILVPTSSARNSIMPTV